MSIRFIEADTGVSPEELVEQTSPVRESLSGDTDLLTHQPSGSPAHSFGDTSPHPPARLSKSASSALSRGGSSQLKRKSLGRKVASPNRGTGGDCYGEALGAVSKVILAGSFGDICAALIHTHRGQQQHLFWTFSGHLVSFCLDRLPEFSVREFPSLVRKAVSLPSVSRVCCITDSDVLILNPRTVQVDHQLPFSLASSCVSLLDASLLYKQPKSKPTFTKTSTKTTTTTTTTALSSTDEQPSSTSEQPLDTPLPKRFVAHIFAAVGSHVIEWRLTLFKTQSPHGRKSSVYSSLKQSRSVALADPISCAELSHSDGTSAAHLFVASPSGLVRVLSAPGLAVLCSTQACSHPRELAYLHPLLYGAQADGSLEVWKFKESSGQLLKFCQVQLPAAFVEHFVMRSAAASEALFLASSCLLYLSAGPEKGGGAASASGAPESPEAMLLMAQTLLTSVRAATQNAAKVLSIAGALIEQTQGVSLIDQEPGVAGIVRDTLYLSAQLISRFVDELNQRCLSEATCDAMLLGLSRLVTMPRSSGQAKSAAMPPIILPNRLFQPIGKPRLSRPQLLPDPANRGGHTNGLHPSTP
ncbi:MAG: hypothetical protein Q8P67_21295, partial [archaeon]|nr:hypothetical protein [archaeon]